METLTLKELLGFLTKYTNWTLDHKAGEFNLVFTDRQKSRGLVRNGKEFKLVKELKRSKTKKMEKKNKRKCLVKKENLITAKGGRQHLQKSFLQRVNSVGTICSCDSLMWDNYDVEGDKPSPQGTEIPIPKSLSTSRQSSVLYDYDDLAFSFGSPSIVASRDSTPDNMREGRRLLAEMREVRQEIRKLGDASSIQMPKVEEIKTKLDREETKARDQRMREMFKAMMSKSDEDLEEVKEETTNIVSSVMWDSGYLDDNGVDIDSSESERYACKAKNISEEAIPSTETSDKTTAVISVNVKPSPLKPERFPAAEITERHADITVYSCADNNDEKMKENSPRQKVSKSQKKRNKKRRSANAAISNPTPPSTEETPISFIFPPAFRASVPNSENRSSALADTFGFANSNSDILQQIIENTSPDIASTSAVAYKKLQFRELFEWEVGFCKDEVQFKDLMSKKSLARKSCIQQAIKWDLAERGGENYKKLQASIMSM